MDANSTETILRDRGRQPASQLVVDMEFRMEVGMGSPVRAEGHTGDAIRVVEE